MVKLKKTEHKGAKNQGGYCGLRIEAKKNSKKLRRKIGKQLAKATDLGDS